MFVFLCLAKITDAASEWNKQTCLFIAELQERNLD